MNDRALHQHPAIDGREFSLFDAVSIAYRRRWVVLFVFATVMGGFLGFSLTAPPVYQAGTTVTVDKSMPVVLYERSGEPSLFSDQPSGQTTNAQTLAEFVKSEAVKDGASARLEPSLGAEAARSVISGVSVQTVLGTELVRITATHTNPEIAAMTANAVADSLVDLSLKSRRRRTTQTREFVEEQLERAGKKLQDSEAALLAFKRSRGDVSLNEETTIRLQKLADLEAQRVDIRLARDGNPGPIADLTKQLDALVIELSGLERQFTSRHPAVISTEAKIAETKQRLDTALARHRETDSRREHSIAAAIALHERRLQGLPDRQSELARLTRDVKVAEDTYLLLSTKSQQARVAEASIGSGAQVVDVAKIPDRPARSRVLRIVWLGLLLGSTLGLGGALVMEQVDRRLKFAEDVERILRAPVAGAIPQLEDRPRKNGQRRGTGSDSSPLTTPSPATDASQLLCARLLASMNGVSPKCLLVTSALPAEGKSTVASHLAVAFARTGRRTWLVNGNLRGSGPQSLFPEAASPGLTGFLRGQVELETIVRPTVHKDLCFVSNGDPVPNAVELLSSSRMASFLLQARTLADVVLVDCPAILAVPDCEILASRVDGALLVVHLGKTDRVALTHAAERLEKVGVGVVGGVLNRVPPNRRDG